jgi:hypothetical protein
LFGALPLFKCFLAVIQSEIEMVRKMKMGREMEMEWRWGGR